MKIKIKCNKIIMKRKPGILEQTCGKDVVSGISTNLFYAFLRFQACWLENLN